MDVVDPHANSGEVMHEYGYPVALNPSGKYDAVVVAVAHKDYIDLKEGDFIGMMNENGILVDVKGLYRKQIKKLTYWSL
jgi:UDP-N-acetyl-D-galactosamine dehydrogenase